jgi:isocitrate dehydrogenase
LSVANYVDTVVEKSALKQYKIDDHEQKTLVGIDVFVQLNCNSAHTVTDLVSKASTGEIELKTIANKGLLLWPRKDPAHFVGDHWCLRYMPKSGDMSHKQIAELLEALSKVGVDFIKTENLYNFDGVRGYSLAQGE